MLVLKVFWILPSLFFLWHNCCLQRYVRRRSFYKYSGDNGGASLTIQPSLSLISNHFSVLMLNLLYKWSLSGRHISWSQILQIYRIQPSDQILAKSWAIIENIRQGSIALKLAIFNWIQYPYLRFAFKVFIRLFCFEQMHFFFQWSANLQQCIRPWLKIMVAASVFLLDSEQILFEKFGSIKVFQSWNFSWELMRNLKWCHF